MTFYLQSPKSSSTPTVSGTGEEDSQVPYFHAFLPPQAHQQHNQFMMASFGNTGGTGNSATLNPFERSFESLNGTGTGQGKFNSSNPMVFLPIQQTLMGAGLGYNSSGGGVPNGNATMPPLMMVHTGGSDDLRGMRLEFGASGPMIIPSPFGGSADANSLNGMTATANAYGTKGGTFDGSGPFRAIFNTSGNGIYDPMTSSPAIEIPYSHRNALSMQRDEYLQQSNPVGIANMYYPSAAAFATAAAAPHMQQFHLNLPAQLQTHPMEEEEESEIDYQDDQTSPIIQQQQQQQQHQQLHQHDLMGLQHPSVVQQYHPSDSIHLSTVKEDVLSDTASVISATDSHGRGAGGAKQKRTRQPRGGAKGAIQDPSLQQQQPQLQSPDAYDVEKELNEIRNLKLMMEKSQSKMRHDNEMLMSRYNMTSN